MREILFRAKTSDEVRGFNFAPNGTWVYGLYMDKVGLPVVSQFEQSRSDYVDYEVDRTTVGQFTGLTDKNGKQIFEGDIVKDGFGRIMKIIFMESWAKYQLVLVKATGEKWTNNFIRADLTDWFVGVCPDALPEIIGNIYDNPELLGVAK